MEIKQLHLRNEHMSKENLLKKEAVEHLKLAFTEEKLSCSQELAESEQKIIDLQLRYEEKIKEQEINLKNALLEASKYQMQNALFAQRTFSRSQEAKLARIQVLHPSLQEKITLYLNIYLHFIQVGKQDSAAARDRSTLSRNGCK